MIVVLEADNALRLRRVTMRDRLVARLRASALDQQLAAGAAPESSISLSVHAGHLCTPAQRRLLARSLSRIATAGDAPAGSRLTSPLCRPAVRRARSELQAVIDRLLASGPVDVHGVARIRRLVADGGGPLYRQSSADHLQAELRAVLVAMNSFI